MQIQCIITVLSFFIACGKTSTLGSKYSINFKLIFFSAGLGCSNISHKNQQCIYNKDEEEGDATAS